MDFHPYADSYPMLDAESFAAHKESIRDHGQLESVKYRMVKGQKQGLDGRNREKACEELGIKCNYEKVNVPDEDVKDYIDGCNLHRRHLTREERRERIAHELKADPEQSNRQVAAKTGTSDKTVATVRDSMESTAEIPQLTETTGRDRKKRPARTKPRAAQPCERCRRIGTPSCPACKEAFPNGFPAESNGTVADTPLFDANEQPVPEQAADAFRAASDMGAFCRTIDALVRQVDELAKGPAGRLIRQGAEGIKQHLKNARGTVWANRPTHVCPYCDGKKDKCDCCKGEGWTSYHIWHQAPGNNEKAKRN